MQTEIMAKEQALETKRWKIKSNDSPPLIATKQLTTIDLISNLFFDEEGGLKKNLRNQFDAREGQSHLIAFSENNDLRFQLKMRVDNLDAADGKNCVSHVLSQSLNEFDEQLLNPCLLFCCTDANVVKQLVDYLKLEHIILDQDKIIGVSILCGGDRDQLLHHDVKRKLTSWGETASAKYEECIDGWDSDPEAYDGAMSNSNPPRSTLIGVQTQSNPTAQFRLGLQSDWVDDLKMCVVTPFCFLR